MAYDNSKDERLYTVGDCCGGCIRAELVKYDGGETKVAVTRRFQNAEGVAKVRALGRIAYDEVKAIAALLNEAARVIELNDDKALRKADKEGKRL